ncbi:MAG: DUF1294 domain-containing protein [Lachnospiraceae bacterium]|nr:DUF1294 domain-containing protein [Lachnospiraceae bacterium]
MIIIIVYLIGINIFGFFLMGEDKRRAERKIMRISEFSLFMAALLGGSLGEMIGAKVFHHKTRHPKFMIGLPVIFIAELLAALWFIFLSNYSFILM